MHLLHWLVNEQAPQYYLISPIYVNIRNKSTMCICVYVRTIQCERIFDYFTTTTTATYPKRSPSIRCQNSHTFANDEKQSSKNLYWGFQTPRWLTDDRRNTMDKIITVFEYHFNIMETSITSSYEGVLIFIDNYGWSYWQINFPKANCQVLLIRLFNILFHQYSSF